MNDCSAATILARWTGKLLELLILEEGILGLAWRHPNIIDGRWLGYASLVKLAVLVAQQPCNPQAEERSLGVAPPNPR